MQAEIEAKFLDVNIEDIRAKLEEAGAVCEQPMREMRRVLIEEPHHLAERSFLRVRDEGDKVTLAFKRKTVKRGEDSLSSTHELETVVGDFDTTVQILAEAGWPYVSYQESRRETWRLSDVEVVIDEWPWINPYVEIEGPNEAAVRSAAALLGFGWDQAEFGSVNAIYRRDFPNMKIRGVTETREVRFGDPVPVEFGKKREVA